jgi:hypothetical protein
VRLKYICATVFHNKLLVEVIVAELVARWLGVLLVRGSNPGKLMERALPLSLSLLSCEAI